MIEKYKSYLFNKLFESILNIDSDFNEIISKLSNNRIAKEILDFYTNSVDIKTNINYIKPAKNNDDINFINDTQVDRLKLSNIDPFDRAKNVAKIGRSIRQILVNNNVIVTDQEIEKFVNLYKNAWDKKYSKLSEGFYLMKGEAIRDWYLESNYVSGGGVLNNSCMRYESTQSFLDIYVDNPEVCQLLILIDDSKKLLGRAILWKIDSPKSVRYYLDRVYTRHDNDIEKFIDWFKDFLNIDKDDNKFPAFSVNRRDFNGEMLKVKLKKTRFDKYPYMDTFVILEYDNLILKSATSEDEEIVECVLNNTDGSTEARYHRWSLRLEEYIPRSSAVWVPNIESYMPIEDCFRNSFGNYFLKSNGIFSERYNEYVDKFDLIDNEEFGLIKKDDLIDVFDEVINNVPKMRKSYLISLIKDDEYVRIYISHITFYINKKNLIRDIYNDDWILIPNQKDSIHYIHLYQLSDDIAQDLIENFGLVKIRGCDFYCIKNYIENDIFENFENYLPFISYSSSKYYSSEKSLLSMGKSIEGLNKCVININYYYRDFESMIYQYCMNNIDSMNLLDVASKLEEIEEANTFMITGQSKSFKDEYIKAQNLYEVISGGDFIDYFNKKLNSLIPYSEMYDVLNDEVSLYEMCKYMNNHSFNFSFKNGSQVIQYDPNERRDLNVEKMKIYMDIYEYNILLMFYLYILCQNRNISCRISINHTKPNLTEPTMEVLDILTYTDTWLKSSIIHGIRRKIYTITNVSQAMLDDIDKYIAGFDIYYSGYLDYKSKL